MQQEPARPARRGLWPFLIVGLVMVALAGVVIGAALQPATANKLGYALPRANGLPAQFSYHNMTYHAPDYCAGDSGCDPARAARATEATLQAQGLWPLKQVGQLPTLFAANHPIMEPVNDLSMAGAGTSSAANVTPFILYIADPAAPGAYVLYMRDGGP